MTGRVNRQRMKLMNRNPAFPAGYQRVLFLIAHDHIRQMRTPEEGQHGQVRFTMSPMGRRVDEDRSCLIPQNISGPEIPVDPRRGLIVVKGAVFDDGTRSENRVPFGQRQVSRVNGHVEERTHPILTVKPAP